MVCLKITLNSKLSFVQRSKMSTHDESLRLYEFSQFQAFAEGPPPLFIRFFWGLQGQPLLPALGHRAPWDSQDAAGPGDLSSHQVTGPLGLTDHLFTVLALGFLANWRHEGGEEPRCLKCIKSSY